MHVLVVEQDRLVAEPLRHAGHEVAVAVSGEEALALASGTRFDAIVLAAIRSETESLTACSELRRRCGVTPILLIVAQDEAENRIVGLEAGADDCISAPCAFPELLARLRALTRRVEARG